MCRSTVTLAAMVGMLVRALSAGAQSQRALPPQVGASPRPLTVADVVGLATLGNAGGFQDADVRSPDGDHIALVVARGDLVRNVVWSTLLIFRTSDLLTAPRADTLLTLSSASDRPAISRLRWLPDNRTLVFLGEAAPDTISQIYTVDIRTRQLIQRTHQPTIITAFDVAPSGDPVLYTALPPSDTSQYARWRQHGLVVDPTQLPGNLVMGQWTGHANDISQIFILRHGVVAPVRLPSADSEFTTCWDELLSVSPTGTAALVACLPRTFPAQWAQYRDPFIDELIHKGAWWPQYFVLDLVRDTLEPLMDVPTIYPAFVERVPWAPDGHAVVFGNTFLPLDVSGPRERAWRTAHRAVAEINIHTHAVTVITRRDSLSAVRWDAATNTVELTPMAPDVENGRPRATPPVRYRETATGWTEVHGPTRGHTPLMLTLEQGMNIPPHLSVLTPGTRERRLVLDPNPGLLARVRFGREQVIHWTTPAGAHWDGGLYLPPDYDPRRPYPLVIQMHGFDSTAFWPDGPFSTTNAAQPLANAGIMVLQLGYPQERVPMVSAREAPTVQEGIEAAIAHLDSVGLIDRTRVALVGFSRTCYYTEYMLTHSTYPFAAAVVADGVDYGYLQYLLFGQRSHLEADSTYGGPPFGAMLAHWREQAPGFNLDRVHAPILVETLGPLSVLFEWELYAGLMLQHKPVEMLYLPEGSHILVKPWERLASQQASVDWFRFWLRGAEDPDTAKVEQYTRWHVLRALRDANAARDVSGATRGNR